MKVKQFLAVIAAASVMMTSSQVAFAADSAVESVVESTVEAVVDEAAEEVTDTTPVVAEEPEAGKYDEFVTLADYKNLELELAAGAALAEGDTASIDFVGKIDGEAFDGGTGSYDLVLGSGSFIDGFEDQLIGHTVGESVDVVCTFPEDYGVEELNGKEAVFETTIKSAYKMSVEDALAAVEAQSTVNKYPEALVESLKEEYMAYVKQMVEQYSSYAELADSGVESVVESTVEEAEMSDEEMLAQFGMTEDDMVNAAKAEARLELIVEAILDAEGITKDSEEYNTAMTEMLTGYGIASAEDAIAQGVAETQLHRLAANQAAQNLIKKYQKQVATDSSVAEVVADAVESIAE